MSYHQPADWHERCTIADDTLPHQIRLNNIDNTIVVVACTCGNYNRALNRDELQRALHIYRTEHQPGSPDASDQRITSGPVPMHGQGQSRRE